MKNTTKLPYLDLQLQTSLPYTNEALYVHSKCRNVNVNVNVNVLAWNYDVKS